LSTGGTVEPAMNCWHGRRIGTARQYAQWWIRARLSNLPGKIRMIGADSNVVSAGANFRSDSAVKQRHRGHLMNAACNR